jgi:1-aminocyclopropane-1-carboxylate deaminase/D-cysteine desulfhydrase-like pyridoxal-dependent ACC family enzyme
VKNQLNAPDQLTEFSKDILTDIPTIRVEDPLLKEAGVTLMINRQDLIHPYLSGNKWYKLKYNLIEAKKSGYKTLLTFGGAYSNHIYAAAAVGKIFGFKTIGVIRGEQCTPLNSTLSFASSCGMKLFYLSRQDYRRKHEPEIIQMLEEKFGNFYLIPEGGSNKLAVKGCSEIIQSIHNEFDVICCACGTGGTIAGLICGLNGSRNVLGFSVLRGADFLSRKVEKLVESFSGKIFHNWQINYDHHFGGYARIDIRLINFIEQFEQNTRIPLDPIYTGKMMFGIYELVKQGFFLKGTKIIAIHTGGLQGINGLKEKIIKLKQS